VFWTNLNARLAAQWPRITQTKPALPDAAQHNGIPGKLQYLEEDHK
jgi:ferredoxin